MSIYMDTCPVCGKEFRNSHVESRIWCSVGCQFDAGQPAPPPREPKSKAPAFNPRRCEHGNLVMNGCPTCPPQPDPRDEALRLAKEALKGVAYLNEHEGACHTNDPEPRECDCVLASVTAALAAISEVTKGPK